MNWKEITKDEYMSIHKAKHLTVLETISEYINEFVQDSSGAPLTHIVTIWGDSSGPAVCKYEMKGFIENYFKYEPQTETNEN